MTNEKTSKKYNLNEVRPEKKEYPTPPIDEKSKQKEYPTPQEDNKSNGTKAE